MVWLGRTASRWTPSTKIVLDPQALGKEKITRANLDGTGMEDVITAGTLDEPNEIALDLINQKMYWTEQSAGNTRRANLDGTSIGNVVVSDASNLEFYGIALH